MAEAKTISSKRQKILKSSKMMFVWVAASSAVVAVCLVLCWYLYQHIAFRASVASAKESTASTLRANNEAVPELKENVRLLETNTALQNAKANPDDRTLQVILDALPADANSLALGSSVQDRLLRDVPNIEIESLTVQGEGEQVFASVDGTTAENAIPFSLVVKSPDINSFRELLGRFERSIRVIDVDSVKLEGSEGNYRLTLQAHAYYSPEKTVSLGTKVVKP